MDKPHRFILSSNNTTTYLGPFYHWDIEIHQVEPTTTHLSHTRNIVLVGQTISIDQIELRSNHNHAHKNHISIQRKIKYLSGIILT